MNPRGPGRRSSSKSRKALNASPGGIPAQARTRSRSASPSSIRSTLDRQPWDALRAPLAKAGADPAPAIHRLREYARLLIEWNHSVSNIMSRNDEHRIVERHLRESLDPGFLLKESGCTRWIDFGSGAGLPAIPLSIAGIGARWMLVESRRTKTLFVRKAAQELALDHVNTANERLENFCRLPDHESAFDGFTSRATISLGPTLELAARLVAPGGEAFLWKGSGRAQEMEQEAIWRESWVFVSSTPVGSGLNEVARFKRLINS